MYEEELFPLIEEAVDIAANGSTEEDDDEVDRLLTVPVPPLCPREPIVANGSSEELVMFREDIALVVAANESTGGDAVWGGKDGAGAAKGSDAGPGGGGEGVVAAKESCVGAVGTEAEKGSRVEEETGIGEAETVLSVCATKPRKEVSPDC